LPCRVKHVAMQAREVIGMLQSSAECVVDLPNGALIYYLVLILYSCSIKA
jgi:hypothetical protein